jgi:hypothetical protein
MFITIKIVQHFIINIIIWTSSNHTKRIIFYKYENIQFELLSKSKQKEKGV